MIERSMGHIIADILIISGSVVVPIYMYFAYRRFLAGEFKEIVKWLFYAYLLFAFAQVFHGIVEHFIADTELVQLVERLFFVFGTLCVLCSAILLNKFSKVYGFA